MDTYIPFIHSKPIKFTPYTNTINFGAHFQEEPSIHEWREKEAPLKYFALKRWEYIKVSGRFGSYI
jgi:hypothetical protein